MYFPYFLVHKYKPFWLYMPEKTHLFYSTVFTVFTGRSSIFMSLVHCANCLGVLYPKALEDQISFTWRAANQNLLETLRYE